MHCGPLAQPVPPIHKLAGCVHRREIATFLYNTLFLEQLAL